MSMRRLALRESEGISPPLREASGAPLFSQTKTTGSFHRAAMLMDS